MTDSRERFVALWAEKHGGPSSEEQALIDFIAKEMAAAERRICGDSKTWQPLGILSALNQIETEEQRIARGLVPLVRAAAAEEQAEALRGEASIAVCFAPEPTPRLHSRTFPCWCGGFATAFGRVHLDERVPRGTPGYMFNPDDFEGWFRP